MNSWRILGIQKTENKEDIQAAYRAKLAVTNPEDCPEEFMQLRQALEEALREADSQAQEPGAGRPAMDMQDNPPDCDDSPLGRWMQKVHEQYSSFSRRIDEKQWEELLRSDVCENLDTRLKARSMLLDYMMEHIFFPQSVMQVLDEHFALQEHMEELKEEYPLRFLEVVITESIQRREYPPYAYLKGDDALPFDAYLRLNSQLMECIGNGDTKEARRIIADMELTGIESPFLQIDKARVFCQEERYQEAQNLVDGLFPEYEELEDVRLMKGDLDFFRNDYETARSQYEGVLQQNTESRWARYGLGKCLVKEQRYKEAGDLFCRLLEEDPYDTGAEEWLRQSNALYIGQLKGDLEKGYDEDVLMELSWCYYQNEQYKEVLDLLSDIEPEEANKIQYHSLKGRSLLYLGEEKQALTHLVAWEEILHGLPDGEENRKRKQEQMPYVRMLQSGIYSTQGDKETALALLKQALDDNPEDGEILWQMGQVLYDMWDLDGAVDALTKSIEKNPGFHMVYLLRAKALYRMEYYGQAFDDCEKSLEIYPYELSAYRCKIEILLDAGEVEAAEEIEDWLEKEGLYGSELQFLKGMIQEARESSDKARVIYEDIIASWKEKKEAPENGFELNSLAEVYYRLALMEYRQDGEDFEAAVACIDKGLEADSSCVPLLELKGEIAYQCGHYKETLDLCARILKLAPGKPGVYGMMDSACRGMRQWDRALEYASLQLEQTASGYAYMRRGQILTCLDRLDEAWTDFEKASRLDPDQAYIYNYMGVILEFQDQEEKALDYYCRAIALGEEQDELCEEAYGNACNLYCRKQEFHQAVKVLQCIYEKTGEAKYLYQQVEPLRMGCFFHEAEETLEAYRQADELDRDAFAFRWEQAHIYRDSGNLDKALRLYREAGKKEPGALREAGKILLARDKPRKALACFTKAIRMLGREHELEEDEFLHAEYFLWASKACLRLSKKKEAVDFAEAAIRKIPEDFKKSLSTCLPMVYQALGGAYTVLEDYEGAERILQEALCIRRCDYCNYDSCIDALYELGYLYEQQGNLDKALEYYRKGLKAAPADADLACAAAQLEKGKS